MPKQTPQPEVLKAPAQEDLNAPTQEKRHEKQCVTNVYCGGEEKEKKLCCCCCPEEPSCTWDIYMTRVMVVENQFLDAKAEFMITAYADGQSAVFPGNATWCVASKHWGWVNALKRITSIKIKAGESYNVAVRCDIDEIDVVAGGSLELGSSDIQYITLQCGQQPNRAEVSCTTYRVKAGCGATASFKVEFMAFLRTL